MTTDVAEVYLSKALESLAGAESEFANQRYNNCANRCYYACFQAVIAALIQASIRPTGTEWPHDFVESAFEGQLIYRRKLYPSTLRGTLRRNRELRLIADYRLVQVNETNANRALRRTVELVQALGADERRTS